MLKRISIPACFAFQLALVVAQCGLLVYGKEVAPQGNPTDWAPANLSRVYAYGDFDADHKLDHAELHLAGAHRCIRVRFGNARESHLTFSDTAPPQGSLLVRDVNNDNKPDLVWIFHYQLIPAVWLGDGTGHFVKGSKDSEAREFIFGFPGKRLVNSASIADPLFITDDQVWFNSTSTTTLEAFGDRAFLHVGNNRRRDLGLYLSYLRERGPPLIHPV